jgi:N-acetylmuramoyl-L-alanine amidase
MRVVAISPGHYAAYKGVAKNGYIEYDEVSRIVEILKNKFDLERYRIYIIQGKLEEKVNKINELKPDLAVEVHLGNTNSSSTRGSRSFHMLNDKKSECLSETLLSSCVDLLKTENKGSWVGWFKKVSPSMANSPNVPVPGFKPKVDLFLSKTTCPAALIEPYYISSSSDCEYFKDKYEEIADAIIQGIENYYSLVA